MKESTVRNNLNKLLKVANNKIDINRHERYSMVTLASEDDGVIKVVTMTLDSNRAFKLKQSAIYARKHGLTSITVPYKEAWSITLNDDVPQESYLTDSNVHVLLRKDKITLMTPDRLKAWNRMKAGLSN